ncbi:transposase [Streptomyces collinus]|uniref:transposase n=1 Tax=Streptomyces collinus TaxID=42684 RepID=UPI00369ED3D9
MVQATRMTLGLPAHRIGQLSEEIRDVEARLTRLVKCHAPQLLDVVGIGPDTAVALLITVGDNPERLDSEASFAALCGVSPVERSSGRRQFRRLDRGGDRQANAAQLEGDLRHLGPTSSPGSRSASTRVPVSGQQAHQLASESVHVWGEGVLCVASTWFKVGHLIASNSASSGRAWPPCAWPC